ncbi:MAG TPA: toll/interleukin-1 receptor domain-containing protein, partial [Methyloversatilis sp.]
MNRIFISYRSVDGSKDASRLAEDLGRVFGDDHVFLDRQDLRGGSSWRAEIAGALDHRPVALFLITPDFAGARHPDGRLRIADADDPVRCEIQAAVDAGATLMPLLIDGTPMPAADSLPEALRGITEMHA